MDLAFEQFEPCDKQQPAVSPWSRGPMSPESSAQWPFRSPMNSPVPQSPVTFSQVALSPGGVIRKNAAGMGIPLVLSGPSMPVPIPSPTSRGSPPPAFVCTSPAGRAPATKYVVSSPTVRAHGSTGQPAARPARLSATTMTITMSPASYKGPQSPSGWQPLQSPGAAIRQNAASFGIPLSLRSASEAAVPIPVRTVAGGVVAPSPVSHGQAARTQHPFGGYGSSAVPAGATVVAAAPPACDGVAASSQLTFGPGRPVGVTQSGAAPRPSNIRAIATPLRRVTRGGA